MTRGAATVVIMAKQPAPGSSKTRLMPALDASEAAELAEAFLLDSIALAASLDGVDAQIAISPPESRSWFESVAPSTSLIEQVGDGLAQRLDHVLRTASRANDIAIAINADSPTLPRA